VAKPKVAFFKFSSCSGCQLSLLNLENYLLDILGAVEIPYFVMAQRTNLAGPYDIAFVEGSINTPRELEELKQIRKQSTKIIAFGTCANTGNVQSIKNFIGTQREMEERAGYTHFEDILSFPVKGIEHYIKVDGRILGCAPDLGEILEFLRCALLGINPAFLPHPVCNECKLKENVCLLLSKKQPCMGPVSAGGCGALCPSLNRQCEGCRGPAKDCNPAALARIFQYQLGLSREDIVRKFQKYAGETPEFRKGVEAVR